MSVLYLMDKFPEYTFMSSQPQLYAYLKADYPSLYEKIKEKVAEGRLGSGRFDVAGGRL
ncbi:hypothetical protein Q0F98_17810 [Paenibacillus amylolyticus]|nr:hypothetical protein Q0F98_17810 [Paenibacillus amylolyticus]